MRDRLRTNHFPLTQEFLAMMLGVRRTGITATALGLQSKGLIRYTHGQIGILDPGRLESATCECYGIIKDLVDGFLRS